MFRARIYKHRTFGWWSAEYFAEIGGPAGGKIRRHITTENYYTFDIAIDNATHLCGAANIQQERIYNYANQK